MYLFTNIKNLQTDLLSGKITCVQLIEESIESIQSKKHLNVFLEVFNQSTNFACAKAD